MKRTLQSIVAVFTACLALNAFSEERATPPEAQALVKKAIAYYKKNGREKALADFNRKDGGFVDRDLYVTVYDYQGVSLAHINPKFIGKNMIDLRDENGKYHIKERIELAQQQGSGWQDLAGRVNPTSKKLEAKRMYFEKHDNLVFAAGAYKP
ncbi:MAG TPA: cache domain-containing protein [Usitatibacter sp.]|nr:cache domain-containing protein [Usitatibacter sp.]